MTAFDLLLIHRTNLFLWLILGVIIYLFVTEAKIPLSKRMPKDLIRLKQSVSHFFELLIPWENKEIELLSLNKYGVKTKKSKKSFETIGAFESIYQELIFSYGYKTYPTKEHYAVLYAQTQSDELFYFEYPKEVEVQINGYTLGRLMDNKLYANDGRMLANFLDNAIEGHTALIIGNKDVGHLLQKNTDGNDINPRALDLVNSDFTKEERVIFLTMVIWKIVKNNSTVS